MSPPNTHDSVSQSPAGALIESPAHARGAEDDLTGLLIGGVGGIWALDDATDAWTHFIGLADVEDFERYDNATYVAGVGVGDAKVYRYVGTQGAPWLGVPGIPLFPNFGVSALLAAFGKLYATSIQIGIGVYQYDGTSWSRLNGTALGKGLNGGPSDSQTHALAALGNDLYVAGTFSGVPPFDSPGVARWDGSDWFHPSSPYQSMTNAFDIRVENGDLYVGGNFDLGSGSGNEPEGFARYVGSQWQAVNGKPNQGIEAFTLHDGDFYLATNVSTLLRSSGGGWVTFATANGQIRDVVSDGGYLYAVGAFTVIEGVSALYVARWDGSAWSAVGNPSPSPLNRIRRI